jgi:flagellar protein FlbD
VGLNPLSWQENRKSFLRTVDIGANRLSLIRLRASLPDSRDGRLVGDLFMIQLTRLNHVPLIVNADLIEHVEVTPDTVVALTTGQKFMVLESAEEVVDKVVQYRKAILSSTRCPLKIDTTIAEENAGDSGDSKPAATWVK